VACISFVCFVVAGFVQNPFICLAIGIALVIAALFVLRQTIGVKVTDAPKFQ
jgi:CBS-domain-containing membrane protein